MSGVDWEMQSSVKILPQLLCSGSTGNVGLGLRSERFYSVTLGLSRNRSVLGNQKVIRLLSIIHNGIILDLVCGFGGSVDEDVRADFPLFGSRNLSLYR